MALNKQNSEDDFSLSPEEMKAIGEIELGPSRHEKFLNAHYKKLIVALAVVMVVAVVSIVYGTWRSRQETDGAAALLAAIKAGKVGVLPDATNYDLAALDRMVSEYEGTQAADAAAVLRGMHLIAAGQEKEGVEALEQVAVESREVALRERATAYLAGHYMRGGNNDRALELWRSLAADENSVYYPLALLSLGDMAKEAGEVEQARTYYEKLKDGCPNSPLKGTVAHRLLLLGVDAPLPVAPAPQPEPTPAQNNRSGRFFSADIPE